MLLDSPRLLAGKVILAPLDGPVQGPQLLHSAPAHAEESAGMWRRPAQRTPNAVNIYAHAEESAGMWRRPVVPARVAHDADALDENGYTCYKWVGGKGR